MLLAFVSAPNLPIGIADGHRRFDSAKYISTARSAPKTRQNDTRNKGSAMVSKVLSPQSRLS
jgi:hypothetical protein